MADLWSKFGMGRHYASRRHFQEKARQRGQSRARRLFLWTGLLCLGTELEGCADNRGEPPLKIVGVYDMTGVGALHQGASPLFAWEGDEGVSDSCGPHRAPNGLGRPEAELLSTGQMPVLALLLEHGSSLREATLEAGKFRISLDVRGQAPSRLLLQPAVLPSNVEVVPSLSLVDPLVGQTVFFQLTVQLCIEHKLGRAWIGNDSDEALNEAFMRSSARAPEEAYFRGQGSPVPALLGPPVWALDLYQRDLPPWLSEVWGEWSNPSLIGDELLEADVWGARAPRKETSVARGGEWQRILPFRSGLGAICDSEGLGLSGKGDCLALEAPTASRLTLTLDQPDPAERPTLRAELVGLSRDGTALPGSRLLLNEKVEGDAQAADVVARLPRAIPHFRSRRHPDKVYSLLLIPDWQLVHTVEAGAGLSTSSTISGSSNSIHESSGSEGRKSRHPSLKDGVGWALGHLPDLHVQYVEEGSKGAALDLMTPFRGAGRWLPGQSPGLWASGAPVVLVEDSRNPSMTARQHWAVFRTEWGALQSLGLLLLLWVGLRGLARVGELWQKPPLERAAFWPGTTRGSRPLEDGGQTATRERGPQAKKE